ncbi:hypothetical protein ACWDE9_30995, partial [Streptomyces olivaceoviridis]
MLLRSAGLAPHDIASGAVVRGYLLPWRTWSACRSAGTGAPAPQQPNRALIRPRAVEQLVALADAAAE